ncbi:unnamed protein product [Echinostoma caproni]|uniref:Uncharacterized protein n=1 Tax=Echinostoma caproni TaxID=27848 RepID=A0A183AKX9_9TREM|nr:unnamed protein product [Echinostoma caproni]
MSPIDSVHWVDIRCDIRDVWLTIIVEITLEIVDELSVVSCDFPGFALGNVVAAVASDIGKAEVFKLVVIVVIVIVFVDTTTVTAVDATATVVVTTTAFVVTTTVGIATAAVVVFRMMVLDFDDWNAKFNDSVPSDICTRPVEVISSDDSVHCLGSI